ncbi:MAG: hypothetical protein JW785_06665 [Acidimicrobiia bacterium]|nr:hypothetical protein [Acidimicrobiia bacterium]
MPPGLCYIAVVSLLTGAGMGGFWTVALAARRVPEVSAGRIDIWFHIAAEYATAVALLAGGAAILADHTAAWSAVLSSFGLGLLVYSLAASPGYYAEKRDRGGLLIFAGFWLLAIPAVVLRFAYW